MPHPRSSRRERSERHAHQERDECGSRSVCPDETEEEPGDRPDRGPERARSRDGARRGARPATLEETHQDGAEAVPPDHDESGGDQTRHAFSGSRQKHEAARPHERGSGLNGDHGVDELEPVDEKKRRREDDPAGGDEPDGDAAAQARRRRRPPSPSSCDGASRLRPWAASRPSSCPSPCPHRRALPPDRRAPGRPSAPHRRDAGPRG